MTRDGVCGSGLLNFQELPQVVQQRNGVAEGGEVEQMDTNTEREEGEERSGRQGNIGQDRAESKAGVVGVRRRHGSRRVVCDKWHMVGSAKAADGGRRRSKAKVKQRVNQRARPLVERHREKGLLCGKYVTRSRAWALRGHTEQWMCGGCGGVSTQPAPTHSKSTLKTY
ncbi:hypothetical protein NDU88_001070 [Pleurodeles waltl]|uniref:Uncharacterized protein n=1 Tax=Pleurodeles waltl TaxID=8319 RepID=A0AAV7MKH3_PLEWA|nr:hypothetical protein NDU88_001070 [Pleurodeles waltl]